MRIYGKAGKTKSYLAVGLAKTVYPIKQMRMKHNTKQNPFYLNCFNSFYLPYTYIRCTNVTLSANHIEPPWLFL